MTGICWSNTCVTATHSSILSYLLGISRLCIIMMLKLTLFFLPLYNYMYVKMSIIIPINDLNVTSLFIKVRTVQFFLMNYT